MKRAKDLPKGDQSAPNQAQDIQEIERRLVTRRVAQARIRHLRRQLAQPKEAPSSRAVIESMALERRPLDGMPRASGPSRRTERIALRYKSIMGREEQALRSQAHGMSKTLAELEQEQARLEALLAELPPDLRFVLQQRYERHRHWAQVLEAYQARFPSAPSTERTLRYHARAGLKTLARMARREGPDGD